MAPPTRTPRAAWIEGGLRALAAGGGPDAVRIETLAKSFSDELLPIDLAIRDWARHDATVAARLRRVENRRMQYLRELFGSFCADEEEVEGRAVLAFSLAIGYHFIAADRGARSRSDALELAVRRLPVPDLATGPGVDAEGRDAEAVSDRPRGTAAVADLIDFVEVRHCVTLPLAIGRGIIAWAGIVAVRGHS